MNGFVGAVQFLTRIPVRTSHAIPHVQVVPWFPVVGALIGVAVGGVAAGLGEVVPGTVAAAIAVVTGLLITGAFHEDGLADIADAFGGGATVERRLEILKDSRHGTYGVAALASSIVVRVVAAASIVSAASVFAAFVAAHTLGRTAAVVAMKSAPPAAESGLGASAGRDLSPLAAGVCATTGLGIVTLVTGWWVLPLAAGTILAAAAVVGLAVRKIGGLAGDVLGAVEQVVECTVLVVVSGLALHHRLWWA